jgi:hypothetical protein
MKERVETDHRGDFCDAYVCDLGYLFEAARETKPSSAGPGAAGASQPPACVPSDTWS